MEFSLTVPQSAAGASQIGCFLMVVGPDGKAEQRIVKLGDGDGDTIVLTAGVRGGDVVITGQLQKVRPAAPVAVDDRGPASPR